MTFNEVIEKIAWWKQAAGKNTDICAATEKFWKGLYDTYKKLLQSPETITPESLYMMAGKHWRGGEALSFNMVLYKGGCNAAYIRVAELIKKELES